SKSRLAQQIKYCKNLELKQGKQKKVLSSKKFSVFLTRGSWANIRQQLFFMSPLKVIDLILKTICSIIYNAYLKIIL
ncbi:MAG: hypothetical protein WCS27_13690, partial [Victivallaceae bacterium]